MADAYDEILANARRHAPEAALDGVLVQEMVAGGIEVILGVPIDPLFGPAVIFGLRRHLRRGDGGCELPPRARVGGRALRTVREIRAFPILDGARDKPPADLGALADAIVAVSTLALDLEEWWLSSTSTRSSYFPLGQGVKAGDALIRARSRLSAHK